jgi:hypothetical protein
MLNYKKCRIILDKEKGKKILRKIIRMRNGRR